MNRRALPLLLAAVIGGLAGLVALVTTARTLSTIDTVSFVTYWAVVSATFSFLSGIQFDAARTAAARSWIARPEPEPGQGWTYPAFGLAVGCVFATVVVVSATSWAEHAFHAHAGALVLALTVAAVAFAGQAATVGVLIGSDRLGFAAAALIAEALVRLGALAAVARWSPSLTAFAFAGSGGLWLWLPFALTSQRCRQLLGSVRTGRLLRATRRVISTAVAAGLAGVMLAGIPMLLDSDSRNSADSHALLLALTLSRGPLVIVWSSLQSVLIASVTNRSVRRSVVRRIAFVALASTVCVAIALPIVMRMIDPVYDISQTYAVALAASLISMVVIATTGARCLVLHGSVAYVSGWVAAVASAVILVRVPVDTATGLSVALIASPILGALVHLAPRRRRCGSGADAQRSSIHFEPPAFDHGSEVIR